MARNYAAVPHEYLKIMESLTDAEFGRLMRWLLGYSSGQKSAPLSGNERVLKSLVQMREDQFQAGFAETDERRKKAAAKAAEIRWNNKNAKACEGMPTDARACEAVRSDAKKQNQRQVQTLPAKAGESKKRLCRFHPPAREEVAAYCVQRGNAINPDRFYDHYEANGWKVGKAPMQDWRAAVRNWEQREQEFGARRETANERYSRELQELITAEDGTGGGGFDPWGGA